MFSGLDDLDDLLRRFGDDRGDTSPGARMIEFYTVALKRQDKAKLAEAVTKNNYEVVTIGNQELYALHISACVFVENLGYAYDNLGRISHPRKQELMGLVSAQQGKYDQAIGHFQAAEDMTKNGRISHSLTMYHSGDFSLGRHFRALKTIIEESAQADNILGILNFNRGTLDEAANYFSRAIELSPGVVSFRLNYIAALFAKGDEEGRRLAINELFSNTKTDMNPDSVREYTEKAELSPPKPQLSNIYQVVSSMLGVKP